MSCSYFEEKKRTNSGVRLSRLLWAVLTWTRTRPWTGTVTCQSSGQPDGTGVRVWTAFWFQQVAEDGVRDEVEHISRNVPQDHGPRPSVQALQALSLQDAADAVKRASVQRLTSLTLPRTYWHPHGAQRDVGAIGHVPGKVQVLCKQKAAMKVPAEESNVHFSDHTSLDLPARIICVCIWRRILTRSTGAPRLTDISPVSALATVRSHIPQGCRSSP